MSVGEYPSWKELLRAPAGELGLDVDAAGTDLVDVAQFVITRSGRTTINQAIRDHFHEPDAASVPEALHIIAGLPVTSIWTTNYDKLVEKAYEIRDTPLDIKVRHDDLTVRKRNAQTILYKMHGTSDDANSVIIGKQDFELYARHNPAFLQVLSADYIAKTFLFLGLSFKDPNINYVLATIRSLFGESPPDHYAVMQRPQPHANDPDGNDPAFQNERNRFELWLADMMRYGMHVWAIDDFAEITELLRDLEKSATMNKHDSVYVNGSFEQQDTKSREKMEELCRRLGLLLARRGKRFVSGLGKVVGPSALRGFLEGLPSGQARALHHRIVLGSIQRDHPDAPKRRRELLADCGTCIVVAGTTGTDEDVEVARSLRCPLIPIPGTGGAAARAAAEICSGTVESTDDERRLIADMARAGFDLASADWDDITRVIAVLDRYFARR